MLVAGAGSIGNELNGAELYDPGLGFYPAWQPLLTTVSPSILPDGSALTASGSRFKGISEASGGNGTQNSSSNYPLVQLLSLANEQTLFLPVDTIAGWSDTSFTSTASHSNDYQCERLPHWLRARHFLTNGIPSQSQFVLAAPASSGECTVCHKHSQTLVLPCNSMEYHRHLDHGDSIGACPAPLDEKIDSSNNGEPLMKKRQNISHGTGKQFTRLLPLAALMAALLALTGASPIGRRPIGVSVTPTLGNYPDKSIVLSTNTTVTPDAAPTNATSISVFASTNFKGTLEGNPTTGVVRVTDAHPAGTYPIAVKAFGSNGGSTTTAFNLTVTTPETCLPVNFTPPASTFRRS